MSPITTHVLETSLGRPAMGIEIALQVRSGHDWKELGKGLTDANGRCNALLEEPSLSPGTYRLVFNVGPYYRDQHIETFYSEIPVVFEILQPESHYHVPLLVSPFGYTTYRGS
jgi:5-hydroxyisourate hydrolase